MDEMRIQSKFFKRIINKAIKKAVLNALGCDMNVQLNDLYINHDNTMTTADLNIRVSLNDEQLAKLVEKAGIF